MVATDPRFADSGYANPDVLVSTDWVAEHLDDPKVRIVESDEDVLLYDLGHIPEADRQTVPPDVRDYEPDIALFSGLDGLDTIRELARAAVPALAPGGALLLEIGAGQAPGVRRIMDGIGGLSVTRVRLDLQSIARVVIAVSGKNRP